MTNSLKPTESNQPPGIDYPQIWISLHRIFLAPTEADTEFTSPEQLAQAIADHRRNYNLALADPGYAQEILTNPEAACKRSQMLFACRLIAGHLGQSVGDYNETMGQISQGLNSAGDMEAGFNQLAATKAVCDSLTGTFRLYSSAHSQFLQADKEAAEAGLRPGVTIRLPHELYDQYPFPLTDVILDQPD